MDANSTYLKPKNVPEELKAFLEANPTDWFTNEQLAERLNQYHEINHSTPSGIRNAVTKLKATNLIKTKMTGSLAYRGWHTAPDEANFPAPDTQRRIAARRCNGCGTTFSRYWRSDLEEKNGWLCNNCGMNQRRGRGINRFCAVSDPIDCEGTAPSAEPEYSTSEAGDEKNYSPIAFIRKQPYPTYVDPSKRKCAHCMTTKSAGKWRRDREQPDRYLCNKCGMNQRRAQMRLEQQNSQQQALADPNSTSSNDSTGNQRLTRSSRITKISPCSVCDEQLVSFVTECGHRICGECIPKLIHGKRCDQVLSCFKCELDEAVPVEKLGQFIDSLLSESHSF